MPISRQLKERKERHLGLPATHLCLVFILLVRAFVRLVASTALVLRPTLSAAEADGGIPIYNVPIYDLVKYSFLIFCIFIIP